MDGQRIHFNENVNQKDIYRIRKKVQFFGQKKDREIDLSMYIKGRFDKSKQKLRNLSNSLVAKWMSDQRGGRIIKKKNEILLRPKMDSWLWRAPITRM